MPSIRATLRSVPFGGLWRAGVVYFVGNEMLAMATAWSMVELTGSPLLAALVQTAVFLPMFLLSLPAGVLADTTDRYRLIVASLIAQAAAIALLAALALAGASGPAALLFLVFVTGCSMALLSPAWNSMIVDVVDRAALPHAITAVAMAINGARALGPALAGLVFAYAGEVSVYAACVASSLVMLLAIRRWPPRAHPVSRLPAERFWNGTLSALRFAWHSRVVFAQIVRTIAFGATASALFALLPVIGRQLGLEAAGTGLLMGCIGSGSVMAGLAMGWLHAKVGLEAIVAGGTVAFALATLVAALSAAPVLVCIALLAAGAAWLAVMSTYQTTTQTSAPPWVRSRASALHMWAALGSFALGAALWGTLSDLAGVPAALCTAAACMAAAMLLAWPFPLRMSDVREVTPISKWDDLSFTAEPDPGAGPVSVEIEYRIRPEHAMLFLDSIALLRAPRKRDGARIWRVYRDLDDPSRYVERFVVASWALYLHQRARRTVADRELEAHVRLFVREGWQVRMQHYIAER